MTLFLSRSCDASRACKKYTTGNCDKLFNSQPLIPIRTIYCISSDSVCDMVNGHSLLVEGTKYYIIAHRSWLGMQTTRETYGVPIRGNMGVICMPRLRKHDNCFFLLLFIHYIWSNYHQASNMRRTKSQNFNVSRPVLKLFCQTHWS